MSEHPAWIAAFLNRRAEVEQVLLDVARGKRMPPDAGECRKLAMRLGDPTSEPLDSTLREAVTHMLNDDRNKIITAHRARLAELLKT